MSDTILPLERDVIRKCLEFRSPVAVRLRSQVAAAKVVDRKYTGVGFYTTFTVPTESAVTEIRGRDYRISDVVAELLGSTKHGGGFTLLIRDGQIYQLEG